VYEGDMGDQTGKALAVGLKENQTLQSFALNCEGHMGDETGDETVKALAAALKGNQALQSFTLNCGGCMGDETGKALAAALKENLTLQSFTLTVHKCLCKSPDWCRCVASGNARQARWPLSTPP